MGMDRGVIRSNWNELENYIFYNCVREFGINYSIISKLILFKSENQVKKKFNDEILFNGRIMKRLLHIKRSDIMHKKLLKLLRHNKKISITGSLNVS